MEPKQREQPRKPTAKVAAIPLPYENLNTNMDSNNNNTNTTSPIRSTTNEDKNNNGDGVKAPKRGRQSSKKKTPQADEMLSSPPPKKPPIGVKGMEEEQRAIFQSPPAMPDFYKNYYNNYSCSSAHMSMPIYQQNEVQTIIVKDSKRESSGDAKDGIYRKCLVCGANDRQCGKYTGTGLQVCLCCKQFFQRMVELDREKMDTFKCFQGSGNCQISKETRTLCHFCRFQACLKAGMDRQKIIESKAKRENSGDAKDGIYRNCLVCGANDRQCGKYTGTGLQVCLCCKHFFQRMVESNREKKDTFECSKESGKCLINKETRSSCHFCRFQACLKAGMDRQKIIESKAKRENSGNAKDGIYRNCLVCGANDRQCGKYTGLQVCLCCKQFFQHMVEFDREERDTFKCSQKSGKCLINKETRRSCHFCRFQACLKAGMDRQKIIELKAKREKKYGPGNDN